MHYQLVYDFSQDGVVLTGVIAGIFLCIMLPIGTTWIYFRFRGTFATNTFRNINRLNSPWFLVMLLCCYALAIYICYAFYADFMIATNAIRTNALSVIEGNVTAFKHTIFYGGGKHGGGKKAQDYFCVQNKCFTATNALFSIGYNKLVTDGSPIRNGLPVKIGYLEKDTGLNIILRLEVAN
jgi:hypothetical protein